MTATIIEAVGDGPGTASGTRDREARGGRWARRIAFAGLLSLVVPVVAAVVVSLAGTWHPPSDHGLFEIRVRDVGGPLTPLLGQYSRLGWNHPGPLAYWLLALPYRLFGGTSTGLLVGAVALNTGALVGCLVLARRRGGTVLAVIVGVVLAATVRGSGAAFLFHIWNPDLPMFPTALLILATWSVIEGDVRLLPVIVGVSCFAWQSHLGYLPVTGGLAAIAVTAAVLHLVALGRAAPGERRTRAAVMRPGIVIGATAVTAAVCLAPLVVEQVTTSPGNLRLIANSFRQPTEESAGVGLAARVTAKYLAPHGTWITGDTPADAFSAAATGANPVLLALPTLAVIAAALAAARVRAGGALRFLAVTTAATALAFVAVSRTTGLPFNYLFNWLRPVAALTWASVAWALVVALRRSRWSAAFDRVPVQIAGSLAAATAMLVLAVSSLFNAFALEPHENTPAEGVEALTPATLAAVEGYDHVYLRAVGGWCAGELGHGLAARLVAHGTEVAVPPNLASAYGPERVRTDIVPTVELWCGPPANEVVDDSPTPPVVSDHLLTDAEEAELRSLQEGFRDQLRAARRDDLLPAVDSHMLAHVSTLDLPGVSFERARLDRFMDLMVTSQRSAVVFFRPAGPNEPAPAGPGSP